MRGIRVDRAKKVAHVQGGATWGEFDREAQLFGLATPGGAISSTGVAGLTLGGGIGWLMRSHGLACDNLISADVVTADGEIITASAKKNSDLFWGIRGGGGNFGIVTSFEFKLHEVGEILGGMLVFPQERAKEVLRTYRDVTESAPDALTLFCGLMTSPEGVPIVGMPLCYNGKADDGAKAIAPLRKLGPVADQVVPMPYMALQTMLDGAFPPGLQVYWRSDFLSSLSDDVMDVLIAHMAKVPSPLTAVLVEQMGGAVARVGANDTAFNHRDAKYNLAIISRWIDTSDADRQIAWTRALHDAIRPFTTGGTYVNYLGVGESAERVREAYGAEKHDRLVALKNRFDPTNFFRQNQNIQPTAMR
jgi:FAD/FMN-containing dehydrogenase